MHRLNAPARLALVAGLIAVTSVAGQPRIQPGFEDQHVAYVLFPTALASTPDGRLLVASQYGQLYVLQGDTLLDGPVLDLGGDVCAYRERGLTGIAVDPDFASNHFIYLAYTANTSGQCEGEHENAPVGRVSRFVLDDGNRMARSSEQIILDHIPSPIGVHNLDDVEFGPDGYLYVSVGDGGCDYARDSGCFDSNDAARDLGALTGKVLRVTRDGGIPEDNPFSGAGTVRCGLTGKAAAGQVCQEIFASGLRNPWRLAFDPNAAGVRFFINDVGQDTWEEVNEAVAGADYGWNIREGFCANGSTTDCAAEPPPGLTNPIHAYGREEGCASITGGAFVPNGIWPAEFDGSYLFSDYVCGSIFMLSPAGGGYTRSTLATGLGDSSATDLRFVSTSAGPALYYTSYAQNGEIRRLTYTGSANRRPTAVASAAPTFGEPPLTVVFDGSGSIDPDDDPLSYRWTFGDGETADAGAIVEHTYTVAGTYSATLTVTDPAGAQAVATVRIDAGNSPPVPEILSPAPDARFAVGHTIVLRGRASDPEDGSLPDAALRWRVILHHNTHTHGFIPSTTGAELSFQAPGPENLEAAANSFLEIELTAVDAAGRSATIGQALMPGMVQLTFDADPAGARLRVDNADVATPASFLSWVNFPVSVEAPAQTAPDGGPLVFSAWSDGGGQARTIVTPAASAAYTAYFVQSTSSGGAITATSSSVENDSYPAANAIDGNADTRWSSEFSDPQWLRIDFGAARGFDRVVLHWETAYASAYQLQVSDDGSAWRTVYATDSGDGGIDVVDTPGAAGRFLRIFGTARATEWGYSLYEVEIPGGGPDAPATGGPGSAVALPGLIEAENFDEAGYLDTSPGNEGGHYRQTDVDIEPASDAGGGFNVGWMAAGEWLAYTVDVAEAGVYEVEVRVASEGSGGVFHLEIDGESSTGPIAIPDTGGWQAWTTVGPVQISVPAGRQVWRLVLDAAGPSGWVGNVNWIRAVLPSATTGPATLLRAPYLQQVTANGAVIVWTTRGDGPAAIRYATGAGVAIVPAVTRTFQPADTGLAESFSQHEVRLTGLAPGSIYAYELLTGGQVLPGSTGSITTPSAPGAGAVRFIAFGDSGVGSEAQRALANQMAQDGFDLAIHTGDVAYGTAEGVGGGSYAQYDAWVFGVYGAWMRQRPFYPSIGNHDDEVDAGRPYRDVFVLPENGASAAFPDHAERYYSFDRGPVHFVALDTETAFADPARRAAQLAWLESDLAATSQPWRVVFLHRPPYSAGPRHGSNLDVRRAFAPIFERYGVQLVVAGHEHSYQRTVPLREYEAAGGAVTYVVTGGGGAPLYPAGYADWTAAAASAYHYVRVSVDGCTLRGEAVALGGGVIDRFQLTRCGG